MANIQMNRGTKAEIDNTPITDGLISFDTDNNYIYLDNEGSREFYGGIKVVPNPEEEPTEVLRNIQVGEDVYKISGGHEIQNDAGDTLTQRDVMQFEGVYAYDDDTEGDEKTKISIVREFQSVAEIEALTGEAKKGFQVVQDAEDYIPFTASENIFDNTNTSFTGDNVQDVLEEVDTVNTYATQDNKITVKVNGHTVDLYLNANVSGAITVNGIQLPNGIKPNRIVYFVGKAGDNWYQPYRIDTNGVLTARSGNDVNAIAVDWAIGHTTFIL